MMDLKIKFDDLRLNYGRTLALDNINLSLESGKIYGLIGRNGAGKTSLLSLIAAFQKQSSGKLSVGGQNPFENKKLMSQISFNYKSDYSEQTETALDFFKFSEDYRPHFDLDYSKYLAQELFKYPLDKKVNQLSNGMQSALDVTIGLASKSPITIYDEVHLGMDAPTREKFYQELLKEQEKQKNLVILSTHLVSEMAYLFDHVIILDQGKVMIDQPYDQLMEKGSSITGAVEKVNQFSRDFKVISSKKLGPTKSVMIYEQLSQQNQKEAEKLELEIGPVSLQELFIHLTEEENQDVSKY